MNDIMPPDSDLAKHRDYTRWPSSSLPAQNGMTMRLPWRRGGETPPQQPPRRRRYAATMPCSY